MTSDIQQTVAAQPNLEEAGAAEVAAVVRDQMKEKVSSLRDLLHRLAGPPSAESGDTS